MADSPPQHLEDNPKADRHGDGECPILSCDYGKPPGKKRLRHDVFVHLRKQHQIELPLRGKSGGFNMAEHNKACLEHFVEWADEHDVEHEAETFFKYATQKRKRGATKQAAAQSGAVPDASDIVLPPPPPPRAPYQPGFQTGMAPSASGVGFLPPQVPYQPIFQVGMTPGAFSVGPPLPRAPYPPANVLPAPIVPADTPWYGQRSAVPAAPSFGPQVPRVPNPPAHSLPVPFLPAAPVPAPTPWYGERRASLLYPMSTEEMEMTEVEEEANYVCEIPVDADWGRVTEGHPELSYIVSQLRAGSRSLTSTPIDFRSLLNQGLHQQLIDVFVSALGGRASDLRHDSAYRSFLLALLIMHASDPLIKDLPIFLIEKTKEYRSWLTRQTQTYPDCPHHFYKHCCGTYRAVDGFFDIMYGIYTDILMRNKIDMIPLIDFKSIVTEFGGVEEGKHAMDFSDEYQEVLSKDHEFLYDVLLKAMHAWLLDLTNFKQASFKHLVFQLDAAEERRDRISRGLEV